VPPLRERLEDVSELVHFFLFRFDRELNLDLRGFAPEALEVLQSYAWPGNVRELQGVVKQAMLNASGRLVLAEFLPEHLLAATHPAASAAGPDGGVAEAEAAAFDLAAFIESRLPTAAGSLYAEVIGAVERILLARVLRHTHGHQIQASELLGISRGTLRHRMRTLGMTMGRTVVEDEPGAPAGPD
jgi:two-component system nitrogen regulation response regulator GlnG